MDPTQYNLHHPIPRSHGGRETVMVSIQPHACHHTVASNHLAPESLACYSYWIQQVYGWGIYLEWKRPGAFYYSPLVYDSSMQRSRDITISIALRIMFGDNPSPKIIIRSLQRTWVRPEGNIRFRK